MTEQDSNNDSIDDSQNVTRQKIIFVGDPGVGKTTIISRIMDNPFNDAYEPSIGVDFMSKTITYKGQSTKLQMWDTAGQEKYKGLIPSYVRNSSIVFIVYDVSNRSSFDNVQNWLSFVKNIEKTTMILCGNKIDLEREVETKEGQEIADKEGIKFFECSAKTNDNIKNMFYASIAGLPTFGVYEESERENLVKELLEENGGEEENQNGNSDNLVKQPPAQINVDGKINSSNNRKRKCAC